MQLKVQGGPFWVQAFWVQYVYIEANTLLFLKKGAIWYKPHEPEHATPTKCLTIISSSSQRLTPPNTNTSYAKSTSLTLYCKVLPQYHKQ